MNWTIESRDVLEWAKEYSGKKFHALLCDPPYHLTSITKRFGKNGSKPARYGKDGAFARASRGFMSQTWDGGDIAFRPETWEGLVKHLYPGAFVFAFAGSRGYHRMACAMEDAGLIIHPAIGWVFGSGFPKATRLDKQIDKAAGESGELNVSDDATRNRRMNFGMTNGGGAVYYASTEVAQVWTGHRYGLQALKPAFEFIAVAQVPYEGRPVDSITSTGAGALNIDGGRIGTGQEVISEVIDYGRKGIPHAQENGGRPWIEDRIQQGIPVKHYVPSSSGRWPANFVLSHSPGCVRVGVKKVSGNGNQAGGGTGGIWSGESNTPVSRGYADSDGLESIEEWECEPNCPIKMIDEQAGQTGNGWKRNYGEDDYKGKQYKGGAFGGGGYLGNSTYSDNGNTHASRFFFNGNWSYEIEERLDETSPVYYCAKAGRKERDLGLDEFPVLPAGGLEGRNKELRKNNDGLDGQFTYARNFHPTAKPIRLCNHIASLCLPPSEYSPRRLLVPFCGSGSEMIGALLAGWEEVVGIEMSKEYCEIAEARLAYWSGHTPSQKKSTVHKKVETKKDDKPEQLVFGLT